MKLKTRLGMAAAFIAATAGLAWGAGNWSTLPVVGGSSFCGSTVTGVVGGGGVTGQGAPTTGGNSICGQTIPAGPAETGLETVPADTNGNGGGPVQTVAFPVSVLGPLNPKVNRLVGGNMDTNLWQRTVTPVTAAGATVATMSADRWWVIAQGNNLTITNPTPATTAADYLGASGFNTWYRFARPSGTPTGTSCMGQTLEAKAAAPLLGNNAIFSFYAYAPTTYSASNQQITVHVSYFTAADTAGTQAAIGNAGGNSSKAALSVTGQAGGVTGWQDALVGVSLNGANATVASNVATIPLTQTPTRYAVYAPIPAANSSGTAVTGVNVSICGLFVLTTTVATDYFEVTGLQLQLMPSTASQNQPNGVVTPTGFERRVASIEAQEQLYYSYVLEESATAVGSRTICHFTTANTLMQCPVTYPVPLRIAPAAKYTAGFQGFTTTAETTASACTGLATDATVTFIPSVNQTMVACTLAGTTAAVGLSMTLWDLGTGSATGVMQFSAEP